MTRIDRPDLTNESEIYWEEVLQSHGLGERQLGLQEEIEEEEEPTLAQMYDPDQNSDAWTLLEDVDDPAI